MARAAGPFLRFRWLLGAAAVCFLIVCLGGHVHAEEAAPEAEVAKDGDPIAVEGTSLDELTEEEKAIVKSEAEPHEFQAEVYRLMDIIINSLYTKKEVFLRELISNAADAVEKMRFLSIEDDKALGDIKDLKITVEYDTEAKTITVADSGVGMTKQDLINNLGTVAKSGTTNFLEAVAHGGDVNLIGQFGVGFYSAFLVADRVTVTSKHNDDEQHIWESTADASFTVAKDPRGNTMGRGTRITLHLKEDSMEFLRRSTLQDLMKKYSQFVNFPIYIRIEKTVFEEVPVEEEEPEEEGEVKEGEEKKPKTEKIEKIVHEVKKVNLQKPIWMRPKEELTDDDYTTFYRSIMKDESAREPMTTIHFTAEGEVEFRAILFVPPRIADDPYSQYFNKKHEIKLYVRRVLVSEQFEDIIPNWLSFVKGVIDSDDLPLKVDREAVSQVKVISVISKRVTRKILDVLRKVASDSEDAKQKLTELDEKVRTEERSRTDEHKVEHLDYTEEEKGEKEKLEKTEAKYRHFWSQFGRNLKLGCVDDDGNNRQKIAKLLRYQTSRTDRENFSLQQVIDNMKEGQSAIYYMTGESRERMMDSPLIQGFIKRGIEVLLLSDAVDESCVVTLHDYEGKKLTSIEKGDVSLEQEDPEYFTKLKEYYKPLMTWWKELLGNTGMRFSKVQLSTRLVKDPVGVVASEHGKAAFEEKVVRYQTFVNPDTMVIGKINKILEINPEHPIIKKLRVLHMDDPKSTPLMRMADELAETAILASGYPVDNPTYFANKLYRQFGQQLEISQEEQVSAIDLSDFEVPAEAPETDAEEMDDDLDMPDDLETPSFEKDEL